MKLKMLSIAALTSALLVLAGCAPQAELSISNPWVRSSEYSDHVGGMTGIFMEITNNKSEAVTLVGGSSDQAEMVEIHEVVMSGGEMVMQKKEGGIVILPGETSILEMGGNHVMLMGLTQALLAGDKVSVTLDFEGADDVTLKDLVAKPSDGGDENYHSGEDMEMDH